MKYKVKYTPEFKLTLDKAINSWKNNSWVNQYKIPKVVSHILKSTRDLEDSPNIGEEVSEKYASLNKPTRRLSMDKKSNYMTFYRINKKSHIIYIGSFFNHLQNGVPF